jgi:hypothetical protein
MKPLKTLLCISLMVSGALMGSQAVAADANGSYSVLGSSSCGAFLKALADKSVQNVRDYAWIAGYMTAYNLLTPNTYKILGSSDLPSAELWIKNYCEKNPLDDMAGALEVLMIELYPKRAIKAPK